MNAANLRLLRKKLEINNDQLSAHVQLSPTTDRCDTLLCRGSAIIMDIEALLAKIEDLGEDIEDLKSQLQPLLSGALSETTKKLPVLDRAKLFVIIVYAIESLIFCTRNCNRKTIPRRLN